MLNSPTGNAMSNLIKNTLLDKIGVPMMRQYLNLASTRHKLISGNIANISTPGYRSKDIDFHGELKKFLDNKDHLKVKVTHENHIPIGQSRPKGPELIINKSRSGNGINNVDIDKEVANMAENQIYYTAGARLLAQKFEGIKRVIRSR